jgi:transposase
MDFSQIIIEALGLQDLTINSIKLNSENLSAEITAQMVFEKARCGHCEDFLLEVHQWQDRDIRLPAWGNYSHVTLKLRYPRGLCRSCFKIRTARIPFLHPQFTSLSCGLAEQAGRMMEEYTCAGVARLLRLDEKTLWRLDQWRMKKMHEELDLTEHLSDMNLSKMSADEVHFRTIDEPRRDHPFAPRWSVQFITNLVCTKEAKVIANAAGRDAQALATCLKVLSKPQRLGVEFFAIDMNPGYFRAVSKLCPNTEIAVDRFHLVQQLNEYFDKVRKDELHKAKKNKKEFEEIMLSPSRRFMFLERNAVLSIEESNMLGKLKVLNTNISNAMIIVDYFHKVLEEKGVHGFRSKLATWYGMVRSSKLIPLRKFALLVRKYRMNIEAYIRSNLTTAISEGLNNKIRVLKAMAYGYTNERSFMLKILQRCGLLNSSYIDTRKWYWRVT